MLLNTATNTKLAIFEGYFKSKQGGPSIVMYRPVYKDKDGFTRVAEKARYAQLTDFISLNDKGLNKWDLVILKTIESLKCFDSNGKPYIRITDVIFKKRPNNALIKQFEARWGSKSAKEKKAQDEPSVSKSNKTNKSNNVVSTPLPNTLPSKVPDDNPLGIKTPKTTLLG